jgi:two-component system cell cycle response regulator DivK
MSKRILVVEDQADNRQIIRDMLAPTDYEIMEVESGEEALTTIAKQRPDLILMDIQLPVMDGYTATRRIRSDPKLRSIPIIAVTSYALSGEETKARAAGCDDCVPLVGRSSSARRTRISSATISTARSKSDAPTIFALTSSSTAR